MARLVDAHARCRGPEDEGEPALDLAGFKRQVRDLDLWCSSCMLATEGEEPVAVLFGAKRASETLVHTVRVHPAHRRRGHARHLLTSLGQKLAILGPPRLVAEVPVARAPACALFAACGWRREERLVDRRREPEPPAATRSADAAGRELPVAPLVAAEAVASGLLGGRAAAWHRDPVALARAAEPAAGIGFYSPERLEACVLFRTGDDGCELVAVGAAAGELGRPALRLLLAELDRRNGGRPLRMERVADGEPAAGLLAELGFTPGREHVRFATEARAA
jgi:GNAT superfamily N-acetyltransferase